MLKRTITILWLILVAAAVLGSCWWAHRSVGEQSLRVIARLPSHPVGWQLVWAGGPVCVSISSGVEYIRFNNRGNVVGKIRDKAHFACLPLSIECNQRLVLSQYLSPLVTGIFDLRSGRFECAESTGKAAWSVTSAYNLGRFWNADCTRFVAYSLPDRHYLKQLMLIDRKTRTTTTWRLPAGSMIHGIRGDSDSRPWILTRDPGFLYRMGSSEPRKRIPALDGMRSGLLSPGLDRAVAWFAFGTKEPRLFYVDFSSPNNIRPIRVQDTRSISGARVDWATRSPTGRAIALLLEDQGSAELYVGDPAQKLHRINCPNGFRFPSLGWSSNDELLEAYNTLPSGTVVWNQDGSVLYLSPGTAASKAKRPPALLSRASGDVDW